LRTKVTLQVCCSSRVCDRSHTTSMRTVWYNQKPI